MNLNPKLPPLPMSFPLTFLTSFLMFKHRTSIVRPCQGRHTLPLSPLFQLAPSKINPPPLPSLFSSVLIFMDCGSPKLGF